MKAGQNTVFPIRKIVSGETKLFDIFRWGNYLKVSKFLVHTDIDYILEKNGDTIQGGILFKGGY